MPLPSTQTSRLGFHYFPDDAHYRDSDLAAWLPELTAMGISWLTLTGSPARGIPEAFIRGLLANGIEPIIHMPVAPIRPLEPEALAAQMRAYAGWGAHYVVAYAEPNSRGAWASGEWGKIGLIERFVDTLLPTLNTAYEAGLTPVFPPLAPGGDYWDTAFLDTALGFLERRGDPEMIDRLAIGAYLWSYNRPLDWGQGGPSRWPQARPYLTPPTSQDQRGFPIFEWYDEIVRARLGASHPILCVAGGARLGENTDPRYAPIDEARHTSCNLQIANAAIRGELPSYLLNVSYWLLAADAGGPVAAQAAYRPNGTTVPLVPALKQLAFENDLARPAQTPAVLAATASVAAVAADAAAHHGKNGATRLPKNDVKQLYHYVLLPVFEWGVSDWHWNAALDYVRTFKPAVGFSPNEAALARFITIVGNEQGISNDIEKALRTSGCVVDRVSGRDGDETRARLVDMAHRNQRFQSGVDST